MATTYIRKDAAADRLRQILEVESSARLKFKRARAERFVELVRGGARMTAVWQELAADDRLQALEDEYERARIDLVVENAINWGKLGEAPAVSDE